MCRNGSRTCERFIEFVVGEVFVFIKQPFCSPRLVNCATAGLKEGKKLSGEAPSPGFRPWSLENLAKTLANLSRSKRYETRARVFSLRQGSGILPTGAAETFR